MFVINRGNQGYDREHVKRDVVNEVLKFARDSFSTAPILLHKEVSYSCDPTLKFSTNGYKWQLEIRYRADVLQRMSNLI